MIRANIMVAYGAVHVSRSKRDREVALRIVHDGPVSPADIVKYISPEQALELAKHLTTAAKGE